MEAPATHKGLKFGGMYAYVISFLSVFLTACIPLATLMMWLIDKKLPTSSKSSGTKWKIWIATGVGAQIILTIMIVIFTPSDTKSSTKNNIENSVETVLEDKRQCTEIEKDLVAAYDSAIGATLQLKTQTVSALEMAQETSPSQQKLDRAIQKINSQSAAVGKYGVTIGNLSQEYGDECADSRRAEFSDEQIKPRQEKLNALSGETVGSKDTLSKEVKVINEKAELERKAAKEKADLERITLEQRKAAKALYKYQFVKEASKPEVRSQKDKYFNEYLIDLGATTHNKNNYGDDPILLALKAEAKAEVVRMDNDVRAQLIAKQLANGTTISAMSNYDLIKELEPDHPAVARYAKDFAPKPKQVVKEQPKPAAPRYKSAGVALREICEAGKEYSEDGFGTPKQIAHELAYWVIDLHKQTGGKASEASLRKAGSDGYMFENCSNY